MKRVKEGGIDPATMDIAIPVELGDDDDWFRDGDDLLSTTSVTIPRGEPNSEYSGTQILQLTCTKKGYVRGVGPGAGSSGEGTAEVCAAVNFKPTSTKDVKCK